MRRIAVLFLAAALCLCLAACSKAPEQSSQQPPAEAAGAEEAGGTQQQSGRSDHSKHAAEKPEEPAGQSIELAGPWHLDDEKNDLAAFANALELFPGYGEWGAAMEIQSNGQMNWYIGAEGWHGTYTVEDGVLHAQMTSDLDQSTRLWDLRITIEEETAVLEMEDGDRTIYWVYGDQEDSAGGAGNT